MRVFLLLIFSKTCLASSNSLAGPTEAVNSLAIAASQLSASLDAEPKIEALGQAELRALPELMLAPPLDCLRGAADAPAAPLERPERIEVQSKHTDHEGASVRPPPVTLVTRQAQPVTTPAGADLDGRLDITKWAVSGVV